MNRTTILWQRWVKEVSINTHTQAQKITNKLLAANKPLPLMIHSKHSAPLSHHLAAFRVQQWCLTLLPIVCESFHSSCRRTQTRWFESLAATLERSTLCSASTLIKSADCHSTLIRQCCEYSGLSRDMLEKHHKALKITEGTNSDTYLKRTPDGKMCNVVRSVVRSRFTLVTHKTEALSSF